MCVGETIEYKGGSRKIIPILVLVLAFAIGTEPYYTQIWLAFLEAV